MTPRVRRQVLKEWRGFPTPRKEDRCVAVADVLGKLMPKLGLKERLEEAAVLTAWRSIVGDFLAQHSRPVRLQEGVLFVEVLQPSVRYELERTCKPEILRKLKEKFGARRIKDVRFRL